MPKTLFSLTIFLLLAYIAADAAEVIPRGSVYSPLTGVPSGEKIASSPDPLVAYRWKATSADDDLQAYTLRPVSISYDEPRNVSAGKSHDLTISGPCNIMLDFGQVNAGWLEFDCGELPATVECSISEFNEPVTIQRTR